MTTGENIYSDMVELEKRAWDGGDLYEEDKTLLGNVMDFIDEYKSEFINYFNERSE